MQKTGKSICVTKEEVQKFIGIYLVFGIADMPSVGLYRQNESRLPPIADMTSTNRLEILHSNLNFEDNLSATEAHKKDKFWKIRTWILLLRGAVQLTGLKIFHSVNEIMV